MRILQADDAPRRSEDLTSVGRTNLHFRCALEFATLRLAHTSDSLVRVSRRVRASTDLLDGERPTATVRVACCTSWPHACRASEPGHRELTPERKLHPGPPVRVQQFPSLNPLKMHPRTGQGPRGRSLLIRQPGLPGP